MINAFLPGHRVRFTTKSGRSIEGVVFDAGVHLGRVLVSWVDSVSGTTRAHYQEQLEFVTA